MKTTEHISVVWVRIRLNHPTLEGQGAEMNFMFDQQPQAADILEAYASEPFWNRHKHRDAYVPVLTQCLETFGIPQLGKLNMMDKDGYGLAVPMVTAEWSANVVGRSVAQQHHIGEIRLTLKSFNGVRKPEPIEPPAPAKPVKSRSRTVGGHQPTTFPNGRKAKAPPRKP